MTGRLSGKTVLVTGAGQGIGRAAAEAFAAEGAHVIATDLQESKLAPLANNPAVECRKLDVTDRSQVATVVGGVRNLSALLNCAGVTHYGTILECSQADWQIANRLNVESCYHTISAALPVMLAAQGGSIINIASVVSSIKGAPGRFIYATTKAAVIGLTKAVAVDFIRSGIRCNAVCPGMIDTPSVESRIAANDDPEQARRDFSQRQPIGRLGTAAEVAAICVYLASDESGYTTGAVFTIDGGMSAI